MECEESKAPTLKINFDDEEERTVILGKVAVKEKNRMNTTNKNRQKSAVEIPKVSPKNNLSLATRILKPKLNPLLPAI